MGFNQGELPMQKVKNKTFENEDITIDEHEYINCRFVNCSFTYSGSPFALINTDFEISGGLRLNFGPPAEGTLKFLSVMYRSFPSHIEDLFKQMRKEGTSYGSINLWPAHFPSS